MEEGGKDIAKFSDGWLPSNETLMGQQLNINTTSNLSISGNVSNFEESQQNTKKTNLGRFCANMRENNY